MNNHNKNNRENKIIRVTTTARVTLIKQQPTPSHPTTGKIIEPVLQPKTMTRIRTIKTKI